MCISDRIITGCKMSDQFKKNIRSLSDRFDRAAKSIKPTKEFKQAVKELDLAIKGLKRNEKFKKEYKEVDSMF